MTTKAITFKLLPLTKSKRERLLKMSENFKLIYNLTAMRLPSLQLIKKPENTLWYGDGLVKTKIPSGKSSVINRLRRQLTNVTTIHSKIAEEAIKSARANYQTIMTSGENINPKLIKDIICVHNQSWSFKKHEDRIYLVIPSEKIGKKYIPLWLPIKSSLYHDELINNNIKFGAGQINIDSETFTTSIEVPTTELKYTPETFIGIDLGKNNLAVAVVLDKDGFKESKFWNGKENRHIRKSFDKYREDVAKIGRVDLLEEPTRYEHNWMKNVNHNISREIITLSEKYPNPIIIMEDLHKFTNYKWNFYQLRQMIKYKAEMEGIKTIVVVPKFTSQTCPKCGCIDKRNRENGSIRFKCVKCNYQNNADFIGAWNIAMKKNIIGV